MIDFFITFYDFIEHATVIEPYTLVYHADNSFQRKYTLTFIKPLTNNYIRASVALEREQTNKAGLTCTI